MCTLQGHNRGVKHLSISDKHVATAGHDMSICVWNWRDGSKLATFRGIGQMVNKFYIFIRFNKIVIMTRFRKSDSSIIKGLGMCISRR